MNSFMLPESENSDETGSQKDRLKPTQGVTGSLNSPVTSKKTKLVNNNLPVKKSREAQDQFLWFYQLPKEFIAIF